MDVFALRNELVDEYKRYVESFLDIEDADLRQRVAQEMDGGLRHVTDDDLAGTVEAVPEARMSHPVRRSAAELLMGNRRRLLDVCNDAG